MRKLKKCVKLENDFNSHWIFKRLVKKEQDHMVVLYLIFKKSLLNLFQYYFCFMLFFWVFGCEACGNLSFQTRDRTCTSCIGRWSLNHWTTREVTLFLIFEDVHTDFHSGCTNLHSQKCIRIDFAPYPYQHLIFFYFSPHLKKNNVFIFNWRIITLPCCVGFCHTSARISHWYTYLLSLLNLPPTSHLLPLL